MTPFEAAGYTKDTRFIATRYHLGVQIGDIFRLETDDGTSTPFFQRELGSPLYNSSPVVCLRLPYVEGSSIKVYEEPKGVKGRQESKDPPSIEIEKIPSVTSYRVIGEEGCVIGYITSEDNVIFDFETHQDYTCTIPPYSLREIADKVDELNDVVGLEL